MQIELYQFKFLVSSKVVMKKRNSCFGYPDSCVYVMQGPRKVRDVYRLAKENAPVIIFIDEVDDIATARFYAQTGTDR